VTNQIAIGAHVSSSGGIFTAIERGEAIEAEAIQIFASAPQMWRATKHKPEAIERFRDLHAASSIGEVWIHNIYLANLASDDPELLAKSIDSVVNALTVADAIGAQGVVLHTGSHKGRGLAEVERQVCDAITTILERSPGAAVLALENAAGHGGVIGKEFAELGALLHGVGSPRLQVCVDTCHAFAAGYNLADPEGLAIAMAEFDSEIGLDRLAVVHANDSKMPLGGERDRHENIGDGHIGLDGFRTILAASAFQGRAFLLEVPGIPGADGKADGPDLENVRRLKQIRDAAAPGGAAKSPAKARAKSPAKAKAKSKASKPTKGAPSGAARPSRGTRPPSGGSRRATGT
jgi:deoxyribonuclease-4